MLPRIIFILCAAGRAPAASSLRRLRWRWDCVVWVLQLPASLRPRAREISQFLLQASVVGLGFGMNLHQVIHAWPQRLSSTPYLASASLCSSAWAWAALFRLRRNPAFLISTGTAICGGSAIAAVGPITQASDEEMAISLGTVFVLNSVALLTFPPIGTALQLTQTQFGLWAALAIHDTSSVVGAAAKYGAVALAVATTVKLARAFWIVPVSLGTAMVRGAKAKIQWPWFIGLFCLAAVCNTYLPAGAPVYRHRSQNCKDWLDCDSILDW